jgi:hypothetical protein
MRVIDYLAIAWLLLSKLIDPLGDFAFTVIQTLGELEALGIKIVPVEVEEKITLLTQLVGSSMLNQTEAVQTLEALSTKLVSCLTSSQIANCNCTDILPLQAQLQCSRNPTYCEDGTFPTPNFQCESKLRFQNRVYIKFKFQPISTQTNSFGNAAVWYPYVSNWPTSKDMLALYYTSNDGTGKSGWGIRNRLANGFTKDYFQYNYYGGGSYSNLGTAGRINEVYLEYDRTFRLKVNGFTIPLKKFYFVDPNSIWLRWFAIDGAKVSLQNHNSYYNAACPFSLIEIISFLST